MSMRTVEQVAHEAIDRIAAAHDVPSMGYDDGVDWEDVIVGSLATLYGMAEQEIEEAMYEIEHADSDSPHWD